MTNWISLAEDLPINGKVNTICPENCGSGEKLSVNNSIKSYWCNCYRCGFNDSVYKGKQTLKELTRIQELNKVADDLELTLELPNDYTTELPRHARAWLFQSGLSEVRYKYYSVGYSKQLDRVILPIYDTQRNLIWYQCRALLTGQKPKYIQPARDRSKIMFQAGCSERDLHRVIVVEDILSAIRVGAHVPTISLLGTKITTAQAAELGKYQVVITWMDSDKAGRKGAYSIRQTMGLITEVRNIVTTLDPKELSDKEIIKQIR